MFARLYTVAKGWERERVCVREREGQRETDRERQRDRQRETERAREKERGQTELRVYLQRPPETHTHTHIYIYIQPCCLVVISANKFAFVCLVYIPAHKCTVQLRTLNFLFNTNNSLLLTEMLLYWDHIKVIWNMYRIQGKRFCFIN